MSLEKSAAHASIWGRRQGSLSHEYLGRSFGTIISVFRTELRLQFVSFSSWIILALSSVVAGIYAFIAPDIRSYISSGQIAIGVMVPATDIALLTSPFIFYAIFSRDAQRKATALIWVRPITASEYAIGKALAAVFLSLLLGTFPIAIGYLVSSVVWGGIQPLAPWLTMLAIELPANVLMAVISLLLIRVTPFPLLGALFSTAIAFFFAFFQPSFTLFDITNLSANNVFYSSSIGLGPDFTLVLLQRSLYLLGAGVGLGILSLIFHLFERLSPPRLYQVLTIGGCVVLLGAVFMNSYSNYSVQAQQYQDTGLFPAQPQDNVQATHYQLSVTANPTTGQLDGNATFILTPGKQPKKELYLVLNPGLRIQSIALSENLTTNTFAKQVPFTSRHGWSSIDLSQTAFSLGQPVHVQVMYAGHINLNRENYSSAVGGMDNADSINTIVNYLGQGIGFLSGNGAGVWYPLPWTQQVTQYGDRWPIDSISLRFPAGFQLVSSLHPFQITADKQWQAMTAHPSAPLPMALAAAIRNPHTTAIANTQVLYLGQTFDAFQQRSYTASLQVLSRLATQMSTQAASANDWQAIVLPFIHQPIIGEKVVFLPESPVLTINAGNLNLKDDTVLYHLNGAKMTLAWWRNALQGQGFFEEQEPSVQQPDGFTYFGRYIPIGDVFAEYNAPILADHLLGTATLARQVVLCKEEVQAYIQVRTKGGGTASNLQKVDNLDSQLNLLGMGPCDTQTAVLYYLHAKYGEEQVNRILQAFAATDSQQIGTMDQFLTVANKVMKRDIRAEVKPLINT